MTDLTDSQFNSFKGCIDKHSHLSDRKLLNDNNMKIYKLEKEILEYEKKLEKNEKEKQKKN